MSLVGFGGFFFVVDVLQFRNDELWWWLSFGNLSDFLATQ